MTVTYRRCTERERARLGVVWRAVGSAWRRQSLAPRYPALTRPQGWRAAVASRKAAHAREMAKPQAFALTGDGRHARAALAEHHATEEAKAAALAAARYADWLAQQGRPNRPALSLAAD